MAGFGFGDPTNNSPTDPDPGNEAGADDLNLDPGGPENSVNPLNPNNQVLLISQNSPVAAPDDGSPYESYSADSSARPQSLNDRDLDLDDDSSLDTASIAKGQAYGAAVAAVIGAVTDLVVGTATDALSDLLGLSPSDENDKTGPSVSTTPDNVVAASGNPLAASNDGDTSPTSLSAIASTRFSPSLGAIAPSLTNPSIRAESTGAIDLIAQQNGAPGFRVVDERLAAGGGDVDVDVERGYQLLSSSFSDPQRQGTGATRPYGVSVSSSCFFLVHFLSASSIASPTST
jgi:hypothetical protein